VKSAAAVSLPRVPTAHRPRKAAERAVRLAEKAKRKDGKDRARGSKSDGSGYLTMYFRDMAALHVLRPEEEFTTAKEIEALEVAVWTALLGWAPALALVLDALPAEAAPAEVKALRRPLVGKKLDGAVAKAAARLRDTDLDRLYIEAGWRSPSASRAATSSCPSTAAPPSRSASGCTASTSPPAPPTTRATRS
jgi:hypothetical protein